MIILMKPLISWNHIKSFVARKFFIALIQFNRNLNIVMLCDLYVTYENIPRKLYGLILFSFYAHHVEKMFTLKLWIFVNFTNESFHNSYEHVCAFCWSSNLNCFYFCSIIIKNNLHILKIKCETINKGTSIPVFILDIILDGLFILFTTRNENPGVPWFIRF